MSNCRGCKGYNSGLGDYCLACIVAARQIERKADVPHTKPIVPQCPTDTKTVPQCKLCPTARVSWSNSYCRAHEAQRKARQRHTAQEGVPHPPESV